MYLMAIDEASQHSLCLTVIVVAMSTAWRAVIYSPSSLPTTGQTAVILLALWTSFCRSRVCFSCRYCSTSSFRCYRR